MAHLLKPKSTKKPKVPGPPKDPKTPRNADLIDAFIHLQEIRSKFTPAYEAWLVKYAAEFKRYTKYKYVNYATFTEVVNDFFENLKIILEVSK